MHDETECVAVAFYRSNENARGWEREPELLKESFRAKAELVIRSLHALRQDRSPSFQANRTRLPHTTPQPFVAMLEGPRHIVHSANTSFRRITGHRALIGKSLREAFPEIEGQGYHELFDQVFETAQPYSGTRLPLHVRCRRHGPIEERLIDVQYKPLLGEQGKVLGILVEGRDVTGLIQL